MLEWFKAHKTALIGYSICVGVLLYIYACEPKTRSLTNNGVMVTEPELQAELDHFIATAEIRFASIERQRKLRQLVLTNAMIVVEGQPFNPVGLITGILALYGTAQAAKNTKGAIQNVRTKHKPNSTANT